MPNQDMNRRSKIRVDFQTKIIVNVSDSAVQMDADSKNLSLKGIFVETMEDVPVNSRCRVQVFLVGTTERKPLIMEGTVVRKEAEGIGIAFDSMDLDSYTELKNIVRYNTTDPDEIY